MIIYNLFLYDDEIKGNPRLLAPCSEIEIAKKFATHAYHNFFFFLDLDLPDLEWKKIEQSKSQWPTRHTYSSKILNTKLYFFIEVREVDKMVDL